MQPRPVPARRDLGVALLVIALLGWAVSPAGSQAQRLLAEGG